MTPKEKIMVELELLKRRVSQVEEMHLEARREADTLAQENRALKESLEVQGIQANALLLLSLNLTREKAQR